IKRHYIDNAANKITNYFPRYRDHIKVLKKEGYTIIGYIRKSPGSEPVTRWFD
ncbi:hypothetical protein BC941DRAFT_363650, partial [Chlamydoabsidia padenii]